MRPRTGYFTPTQWVALVMVAVGALGALAARAVLVYGSRLVPQPEVVAAVAARVTLSPRPPTQTLRASETLRVLSATPSPSKTPSPTHSPTSTLSPTATQ